MSDTDEYYKDLLTGAFDAGVMAAQPAVVMLQSWQQDVLPWLNRVAPGRKNLWVYGAGKAAASMAQAIESAAGSTESLRGFVVTRRGHELPTSVIEVVQASHPVPDEDGRTAALRLYRAVSEVPEGDAVVALVSGGGSSLLSLPVEGIPFTDLQQLNRALLACGAPIDEMNIVRKHVTLTLGGQLAKACPAPIFQLLISDVPGDDPTSIASGPFTPDASTYQDALEVLSRWSVQVPESVMNHLKLGLNGERPETPKPDSPLFNKVSSRLLASNSRSLAEVSDYLEKLGYHVLNLGDTLEGEARDVARVHAAIARQVATGQGGWPAAPLALVSGGECTVTLSKSQLQQARGGRNSEFLLALAYCLRDLDVAGACSLPVAALAADTDGIDGIGGHAGALMLPGDQALVRAGKLAQKVFMDQHTSFDYFQQLNRLVVTGPTMTNVNDLRIVLIGRPC